MEYNMLGTLLLLVFKPEQVNKFDRMRVLKHWTCLSLVLIFVSLVGLSSCR